MYNTQLLPAYILDKYDYTETKKAVKKYISRLNSLKWRYEVLQEQKVIANYDYDNFKDCKTFSRERCDNFRLGYLEEIEKEKTILEDAYQKITLEYLSLEERMVIDYLYNKDLSVTEILEELKLDNINGGDLKRELLICKSATIKFAVYLGIEVLKNEN